MNLLHMLAGPLVGAVIGYFTNYIAVKMLFKPLTPVYIFGHRLPLTPGVIPKNKMRIAHACGQAISQSLVTETDLRHAFLSAEAKETVSEKVYAMVSADDFREKCSDDLAEDFLGTEKAKKVKTSLTDYLAEKISGAVTSFDIEGLLSTVGVRMIMEKLGNSMLSMFLNEDTIRSFIEPVGSNIRNYIETNGRETIHAMVRKEINCTCALPIGNLVEMEAHAEEIKAAAGQIYEQCVEKLLPAVIQEIDISGIVVEKIEQMEIGFFEELVLSVIKNELDYIVRLGALIGFIIGTANIFL